MRALAVVIALGLAFALNLLAWYWPNRPITVGQTLGPALAQPLQSVSFAPYRRGQSPLDKSYPSAVEIEADIKAMVGKARALRTYTALEGMDAVPRLAGRYGLKVYHGAWLSGRVDANSQEVTALIEAANRHPEVIERVIVGNEVLLRGELKPHQLAAYIRQVKRAVKQPVTYADVWEKWIETPELADDVDFITIHILPYWENEPIGIGRVERHIQDVYRLVQLRFPGKPILIGETGWPSDGRMRNDAAPGAVNQARYVEIFLRTAERNNWTYNYIEAFDQIWKTHQEGTVGANWGLLDANRHSKFTLGKPMVADAMWLPKALVAGGLGFLAIVVFAARRRQATPGAVLVFALFAQAACALWVLATATNWEHSDYLTRTIGTAALGVLGALFTLIVLRGSAAVLDGQADTLDRIRRVRGSAVTAWREGLGQIWRQPALGVQLLHFVYALLAIWFCAALVFDGRYRDFPVYDFAAAAGLLAAFKLGSLAVSAARGHRAALSEALSVGRPFGWVGSAQAASMKPGFTRLAPIWPELAVSACLLAGAVAIVVREGWLNHQALGWAAIAVLLALPYVATIRLSWALPLAEQPPESFTGKW